MHQGSTSMLPRMCQQAGLQNNKWLHFQTQEMFAEWTKSLSRIVHIWPDTHWLESYFFINSVNINDITQYTLPVYIYNTLLSQTAYGLNVLVSIKYESLYSVWINVFIKNIQNAVSFVLFFITVYKIMTQAQRNLVTFFGSSGKIHKDTNKYWFLLFLEIFLTLHFCLHKYTRTHAHAHARTHTQS